MWTTNYKFIVYFEQIYINVHSRLAVTPSNLTLENIMLQCCTNALLSWKEDPHWGNQNHKVLCFLLVLSCHWTFASSLFFNLPKWHLYRKIVPWKGDGTRRFFYTYTILFIYLPFMLIFEATKCLILHFLQINTLQRIKLSPCLGKKFLRF